MFKVQTSKSLHTLVTTHVANVLFLSALSKIVACRLGSQDVCEIFYFGPVQNCVDIADLGKCEKKLKKEDEKFKFNRVEKPPKFADLLMVTSQGSGMRIT